MTQRKLDDEVEGLQLKIIIIKNKRFVCVREVSWLVCLLHDALFKLHRNCMKHLFGSCIVNVAAAQNKTYIMITEQHKKKQSFDYRGNLHQQKERIHFLNMDKIYIYNSLKVTT